MISTKKLPIKLTSLLAFIFFFSGASAIIYQVVWQRILTIYYGVGAISIALIVSVYMAGLGIGALFGGYLSERAKNKILLYFVVELLIGCFGLISLPFLDFLGRHTAGSSYLLSLLYMFAFLCIPTFLMGITLPLLTKIFNRLIQNFLDTISFLYFINTIGAAVGALFASYIFITFFGLDNAVYIAVFINFILAGLIIYSKYFLLSQPEKEIEYFSSQMIDRDIILGKWAYPLVFITGFLAIGYEIVWFRVIGVLVKASVYAFSTTLSVYLFGIALGSFYMSRYLKSHPKIDKISLFFYLQFFIGLYVIISFLGYYYLTKLTFFDIFTKTSFANILHPPKNISWTIFLSIGKLYRLFDIFFWSMIFVLVPTLLMGTSFPLITSLALSQPNKEGKYTGTVYFFNITGNVFGGVLTGFFILPLLGTEFTIIAFSIVGVIFITLSPIFSHKRFPTLRRISIAVIIAALAIVTLPKGGKLYETMHILPDKVKKGLNINPSEATNNDIVTYLEEGRDGVIVTYQNHERIFNYINGLPHGSRGIFYGHQYEAIEAASFAPQVENVLIIGYGTGDTTKTIINIESVQKVTVIELNQTLMKNVIKIPAIQKELLDKRINLIIEDGRRFLLRTNEKYDVILIDPIRTTTSYSNNLYSLQFFRLASQHLKPDGIFMAWLDEKLVLPKTITTAFKYIRMYKFFILASNTPLIKDHKRFQKLIAASTPREQKGFSKLAADHKGLYLGNEDYVNSITDGYPINQDWKPVCEYYLGLQIKGKGIPKKQL
jgi:predicted membrane-bound spermidine synthase